MSAVIEEVERLVHEYLKGAMPEIGVEPDGRVQLELRIDESVRDPFGTVVRALGQACKYDEVLSVTLGTDTTLCLRLVSSAQALTREPERRLLDASVSELLDERRLTLKFDVPFRPPTRERIAFLLNALVPEERPGPREARSPTETLERCGAEVHDPGADPPHVGGYQDLRRRLREHLLLPLRHPEMYRDVATMTRQSNVSNMPRALLFAGPPGCGKTLAARSVATEAGVPLVYVPVEGVMSKWYGESEQKLARIFTAASRLGPCVLFLDEIDALATARNEQMHEATRRLLSVLLRKLDGILSSGTTPVIGATNRPEDLDSALRSRFAETIVFPLPSAPDRREILRLNAKHLADSDLEELAGLTDGCSGRDLRHLCDRVERSWIASLLDVGKPASPPPLEAYRRALSIVAGPAEDSR